MKKILLDKIKSREAVIGIIGLGYVGLPLMLRFCESGYRVLGFDIDQDKIKKLNAGESYIQHISSANISSARDSLFEATPDFSRAAEADALILCVPTPLNKYREPDISFIINTIDSIRPYFRKGQVISLESTTYPGTTDEELKPRMEAGGMKVGEDLFLLYSAEREDPGNMDFTTKTIPKVYGGITKNCLEVGAALYGAIIDKVVPVSSTRTAELTKLLENIHRAVNISLVNEMKIIADKMGIDIHEVIRAAATKPFGFVPYYPGPGLGGHCIPIDPFYLSWKAREFGLHTRFIELAGEINTSVSNFVISKTTQALNSNKKAIRDSKILILGISYKKNIDDMRESPSVLLMEKLRELGAEISYSDPHIPVFPKMREHKFNLSSIQLNPETIGEYDCLLLATDHDKFDYEMIKKHAKLIIDSRGKYTEAAKNIIKA